VLGGVYAKRGADFSRRKNRFLADFTTGIRRVKWNLKGVAVAGEGFPRPRGCQVLTAFAGIKDVGVCF